MRMERKHRNPPLPPLLSDHLRAKLKILKEIPASPSSTTPLKYPWPLPVPQSHLQRPASPAHPRPRSRFRPVPAPELATRDAGSAAKENAAPLTSDATASAVVVSRRPGYAVKSCGVKKRPSRARLLGRVPLRDITNLIEAISAVAGPEAPLGQEVPPAAATELTKPDAVLPAVVRLAALQDGYAAGPAAKAARYSLRKGFR